MLGNIYLYISIEFGWKKRISKIHTIYKCTYVYFENKPIPKRKTQFRVRTNEIVCVHVYMNVSVCEYVCVYTENGE